MGSTPSLAAAAAVALGLAAFVSKEMAFAVAAPLVTVSEDGQSLSLPEIGVLHSEWLFERCTAPSSVDPTTKQRLYGPHEYAPPVIVGASLVNETQLVVDFHGSKHSSTFDVSELWAEAVGEKQFVQFEETPWRPEVRLWDATLGAPPSFGFEATFHSSPDLLKLYATLQSTGVALVAGAPLEERTCSSMASRLSTLRTTEWGENFNVVSETQSGEGVKRDLAYTANSIHMHTDNPYRYPTPDFQLLHVIEQCECSFEKYADVAFAQPCDECKVHNYFVDGFAVAAKMAEETPDLFESLASVPVRFENNGGDGTSALWHVVPHFETLKDDPDCQKKKRTTGTAKGAARTMTSYDVAKCLLAVRFSSKSGGYAPKLPAEELAVFYRAKRRFAELAHDESMFVKLQLKKGDVAIFDNKRLLHARSAIDGGRRFVQGCYLDRDGIQFHWERVRRKAALGPSWTSLQEAGYEDYVAMGEAYAKIDVAAELLEALDRQKGKFLGQPVDLREHGLQAASRAFRDGASDDLVVAALLHDVTEHLVPKGHGEAAAALLAPYVDPPTHWLLANHEVFQGYYYFHHFNGDRNAKDNLRHSPHFNLTEAWCHLYDQPSFDPLYPTLPFDFFRPILTRVLSREPYWWDLKHLKRIAVTG